MDGLLKVIIPPCMTCMIFTVVEGWCLPVEERITSYLNGISEEWDVDIQVTVDGEGAGVYTCQANLSCGIIVQRLTLLLTQLSTHAQCMLVEFLESAFLVRQSRSARRSSPPSPWPSSSCCCAAGCSRRPRPLRVGRDVWKRTRPESRRLTAGACYHRGETTRRRERA